MKHGNTKERVKLDVDRLLQKYLKRTLGTGDRAGMLQWLANWLYVDPNTVRNYYKHGFPVEEAKLIVNVFGTTMKYLKGE